MIYLSKHRAFLGIDTGVTGAIVLLTEKSIEIHTMPAFDKPQLLLNLIYRLKKKAVDKTGHPPFVVIEEVFSAPNENGKTSNKSFGVGKLREHFGMCHMACYACGLKPLLLLPISWKSYLRLRVTRNKWAKNVKVTTAMKKEKTIKWLNAIYPNVKFNVNECDAFALAVLAKRICKAEIKLKPKHSKQFNLILDITR